MDVILFEDDLTPRLYPVTVGRPAFAITCGGYRLVDLAAELGRVQGLVRPPLRAIVREDFTDRRESDADGRTLVLNARLVPSVESFARLRTLIETTEPCVVPAGPSIAAALLPVNSPLKPQDCDADLVAEYVHGLNLPAVNVELPLLHYPHDIVRYHLATFGENLKHRLAHGHYQQTADGVFVAPGAKLGQFVVADAANGPIVLESGASVGPYCYLSGPALLGANCRVIEHAAIKDGVCLGHTTKIGGEVEASIIEAYTNKQHHGFLGHSYLGSWINLGAGTCNSDLKNTYGMVKMEYGGEKIDTGMQFIGTIIGDYAKTAINTGIFTGKTIGVCSMVYGFVTTNVPSFTNYARSFGQVTETPVEVMVSSQARMFARRKVAQRPIDVELLHDMYDLTRHERQLAGDPLVL